MAGAVHVEGFRELQRALSRAERETRLGVRAELRQVAAPVAATGESLAVGRIRNIGREWPRMRVGVTQTLVYVAPQKRGIKGKGPHPRRRPNLAGLLATRALEPALAQHESRIEGELEQVLDRVADRFN